MRMLILKYLHGINDADFYTYTNRILIVKAHNTHNILRCLIEIQVLKKYRTAIVIK